MSNTVPMTKRAPMSGIIRILKDAQTIGSKFCCTTLCGLQGDNSHSNRQNNRNLIRRANEKGFLAAIATPGVAVSQHELFYNLTAEGRKFLQDANARLSENRSITMAKTPRRVKRSLLLDKRQTFTFVPGEIVTRVPNSVFSIGTCSYSMRSEFQSVL